MRPHRAPGGQPGTAGRLGVVDSIERARVVLIGKPGCHLCDDARTVLARVTAQAGEQFVERSILDDAEREAAYWERIPVVLVDGVGTDYWHVDEPRLLASLQG